MRFLASFGNGVTAIAAAGLATVLLAPLSLLWVVAKVLEAAAQVLADAIERLLGISRACADALGGGGR